MSKRGELGALQTPPALSPDAVLASAQGLGPMGSMAVPPLMAASACDLVPTWSQMSSHFFSLSY